MAKRATDDAVERRRVLREISRSTDTAPDIATASAAWRGLAFVAVRVSANATATATDPDHH